MTTPPPDALEQIRRLEELRAAAEAKPLGPYRRLALAKYWSASNEVIDWLLPLARAQLEGWRPIETAPRDGTQVLLYFPKRYQGKGGISWGCFIEGDWLDSRASRDNDATHWQPLPSPPQKDEGDG